MDTLYIQGGTPLRGEVTVHGAKNAALPLLAATLLCEGVTELKNCPALSDVEASLAILRHLGCRVEQREETVTVDAGVLTRSDIPDDLMRRMRSSIVFLGALVARCEDVAMTYPGGCELGPRPIDLHLAALRRLGVDVTEEHGCIRCHHCGRLHGASITLAFPSVGATENVLLAAATAEGTTVLRHAAREPEIQNLCDYLNACGAKITVADEGVLVVRGVPRLTGCVHTVIPDRIEAATYLAAAAATGGRICLRHCCPRHLATVTDSLAESGCYITGDHDTVLLEAPMRLSRFERVQTMPYPGFPTDAAAPLVAAAATAAGTSVFVESIFENRYKYVDELARMGARIRVDGRVAIVEGTDRLQGAAVECTDLRGGAALVIAALAAQGKTAITGLHHLDRGYTALTESLRAVGAAVRRESKP